MSSPKVSVGGLGVLSILCAVLIVLLVVIVYLVNQNTERQEQVLQNQEIQIRALTSNTSKGAQILSELQTLQLKIEAEDKNQTDRLLPIFFRSFNQTEVMANQSSQMLNQSKEMLNATKQVQHFINFIGNNFGDEYLLDEVRQYKQSNNTAGNISIINDKLDQILGSQGLVQNRTYP
jgi:hypothetical protein